MDRLALEMDRKWGIDRLPEIVSVETAQKYGKAMAHLNECIREADPIKCAAAAQNCIRGLNAMDAEATAAGKQPASGEFWEYELPGMGGAPAFRFAIMADKAEWRTAQAERPDLQFYTMREVAIALQLKLNSPMVDALKDAFPGAEVQSVRPAKTKPPVDYANGGDALEF
jgi:hypothetical protein